MTTTEIAATWIVTRSASSSSSFSNSVGYQSSVNPCHVKLRSDELKLNRISTTIGANSTTYTSTAYSRSSGLRPACVTR